MRQSSSQNSDYSPVGSHPERTSGEKGPLHAALSVIGVALCWVIEFTYVAELIGGESYSLLSLLFLNASAALCFVLVSFQKEHLLSIRARFLTTCIAGAGVLLCVVAQAYAHIAQSETGAMLASASSLFAGFALAWLMLSWIAGIDTAFRERAPQFVTLAALVGAGIALLISWLQETAEFYSFLFLFVAAYLGLLLFRRYYPEQARPPQTFKLPVPLDRRANYMTALYGLCLGCCFTYALMQQGASFDETLAVSLVALSLAIASVPALLLWQRCPRFLTFGNQHRIMLPLIVLLLLFTALLPPAHLLLIVVLALVAYWGMTLNHASWFVAFARRYGYDPIPYNAEARRLPSLGVTLGILLAGGSLFCHEWLTPFLGEEVPWALTAFAHNSMFAVACGLITLLLVANSLLPFDRGTPMEGMILINLEVSNHTQTADSESESSFAVRPKRFVQQANDLAVKHGLSAREQEVMHLLIRGYTADTIADFLFVSRNTVRTHRANIYQKLDVHSQQELMRLLPIPTPPSAQEDEQ